MGNYRPPRPCAAIGLCILLSTALAQAPQEPLLRITVNLVQVQVVVTDGNERGAHITNLKAGDFRIFQDGKEQKVTHCTYYRTTRPAASKPAPKAGAKEVEGPLPPVKLTSGQVGRTIAIVVDDLDLGYETFQEFVELRRALKKYVTDQIRPGDMVAILRTAGSVGALQQFTADKRKLLAAADSIGFFAKSGYVDAYELQRRLITIAQGLGTLPGQKSIVLFTAGDPIGGSEPYGNMLYNRFRDATSRAAVTVYVVDRAGLPAGALTAAYRASSGGAPGTAVARGLSDMTRVRTAAHDGMNFLARSTGGLFLSNTSDLGGALRTAINDMQGYYLLGYTPEASTFDPVTGRRRFHNISVRMQRPFLKVRTQSGFLGVEDSPAPPAGSTNAVLASLVSPFGSPDLEVGMSSLFFNTADGGSTITTLVNVQARDLTFREEAGTRTAQGDIAVILFGDNGAPVEQTAITFEAPLNAAAYEAALKNGFLYTLHLPVKKPGPYDVRVAVRDKATAKIGTATQFVQVPDLQPGRLALSSILLQPSISGTGPDRGAPDLRGSVALRILHPGDTMTYGYQVLNPKLDAALKRPKVEAQIRLYRDGKEFFVGKPAPVDTGADVRRLLAGGDFKIGPDMPPGEYMLETSVTDLLGGKNPVPVKQLVDFRVAR